MPDALAVLFDRIFSDPNLLISLQEVCRSGRIRALGKRVKYIVNKRRKGRYTVTEFVEPKLESIPADDWADLSLFRFGDELRLEGTEKWVNGDQLYSPKAWASVWFSKRDLLAFAKLLPAHQPSPHAQWIDGEALAREMAKDFPSKMTEPKPSTAKHVTNKSAPKLTNEYITAVKSTGSNPTASGLEKYARDQGLRGGRDLLRLAIKKALGPEFKGRGRPQKFSPK